MMCANTSDRNERGTCTCSYIACEQLLALYICDVINLHEAVGGPISYKYSKQLIITNTFYLSLPNKISALNQIKVNMYSSNRQKTQV